MKRFSGKRKYLNNPADRILADGTIRRFSSTKEATRYDELALLQQAGEISDLQMQVPFVLIPAQYEEVKTITKRGKEKISKKLIERKCQYVADFVYAKNGEVVVEDVKGYKRGQSYTVYAIKRKLLLWVHGIKIVEV